MKKLVFENLDAVHQLNLNVASGKEIANELAEMFNSLGLKKIETTAQLQAMLDNLPAFVQTMLPEGEAFLFGIKLKRAKVVDFLNLDLQPLQDRIAKLPRNLDLQAVAQFCEVAKYGKKGFEGDPELIAKKLESYRVYAVSDRALEVAATFEQLTGALDKMMQYGVSMQQLRGSLYPNIAEYQNGKFVPNVSRFKELAGVINP